MHTYATARVLETTDGRGLSTWFWMQLPTTKIDTEADLDTAFEELGKENWTLLAATSAPEGAMIRHTLFLRDRKSVV